MSRAAMNNRSNQMNPNNGAYWSSRGVSAPGTGSGGGGYGGEVLMREAVTLRFSDGFFRALRAPVFSVAMAVIGKTKDASENFVGHIEVTPGAPTILVFARRAPDEGGAAVTRAKHQYPGLNWVRLSGAQCGTGGGTTPRYWWMKLNAEQDGSISLDEGAGVETLDGLVPGLVSDKGPQPPSGRPAAPSPACPDCKEPMVEGFIPSAAFIQSQIDSRWHEGLASESGLQHFSADGALMDDYSTLHIRSYRCPRCGLLRDYAFGHKDWEAWAFKGWK